MAATTRYHRPSIWIRNAGEITLRLIQQDVSVFSPLQRGIDELSANFDVIGNRISLGAKFSDNLSVDSNLAASNQLLGVTSRRDTGGGD